MHFNQKWYVNCFMKRQRFMKNSDFDADVLLFSEEKVFKKKNNKTLVNKEWER